MVRLGEEKRVRLKEEILSILNESPLKARFTNEIAKELIRDNEFTLKLLMEMRDNGHLKEIRVNKGSYKVRRKWRISDVVLNGWRK